MKHKQTLAMLLAAAMVLSMPLGAYAQGTAEGENSTDSVQPYVVDNKAPVLNSIELSDETVNAGGTLTVTIDAEDDLTGVADWQATFVNKETKKHLTTYLQKYSDAGMLETSKYEPSGTYELESVSLEDKAGNIVFYEKNPGGWEPGDNAIIKKLELEVFFTVINDDPVTPPTQPEGNKPSRPGSSDGNNSANSSNGSGVVNYESEKPDPADKQAVKAYNFWQDAKSKIRKTAEGKTLRLNVSKEITNLPASVMETLRKENVSLRLNWNGKTITIPAGKAQPKQKLRIYWTMQTLEKLYNA